MNYYQKLFTEHLHDFFSFPKFVTMILCKKFTENGIVLKPEQQLQLIEFFEHHKGGGNSEFIFINIDDDGGITFPEEGGESNINIDLSGIANEQIDNVVQHLPEMFVDFAEEMSVPILKSFKETAIKSNSEDKEFLEQFQYRLVETWKEPLQLLEMMVSISEGIGNEYNTFIHQSKEIEDHEPNKLKVLCRLHARACQVAKEVLLLLRNGFADGAHARWRTLHEISVVANFIQHHDDNVAELYLLHDIVERCNEAELYQKHCKELHQTPIPKMELARIRESANALFTKYGNTFKRDYGWASQVLNNKSPTFVDIEKAVRMEHIRPYYKLACINVHAGPHGILFRLGLDNRQMNEILLSGSSNLGLAEPGQNTAYSLLMATISFLMYKPTLDCLVAMKALHKLEIEIYEAFGEVDRKVSQRTQEEIDMYRRSK